MQDGNIATDHLAPCWMHWLPFLETSYQREIHFSRRFLVHPCRAGFCHPVRLL